jgi:tetratricopeptide (TPR) repeat protein
MTVWPSATTTEGVVCKERNEVDRAMTNYLSAAENIEKTRDYYYINLINSYIGHLYTDQMAYDKTYKYFTRAYRAAKAMNDSTGMAYALMDLSGYYDCRRQFQKTVTNAHKAFMLIRCDTTNAYYVTIANDLSNAYWFLKDYKKSLHYALQILPIYSKDTVSDNGPYYSTLAQSYFSLKKYDEAKKYYLLSAKSPVLETRLVSYGCLRDICDVRGESRQAARYQTVADSLTQEVFDQNKAEQLIESKDAYSLQKTEIAGRKAELRNRWIVAVCIVIAVGLAVSVFFFMRRRKARDMKHLRDIYSKMQADWQAEKSREMEQLQQEMEALRTNIGQPQEDAEKMEVLQQRLSQLEADNGKLAEMVAHHKNLHTEIFSGRHDNALACLRKVNTHPKADMITKLDWAQLYLLIDAIDPTFRPTYEPRTTGLMHELPDALSAFSGCSDKPYCHCVQRHQQRVRLEGHLPFQTQRETVILGHFKTALSIFLEDFF